MKNPVYAIVLGFLAVVLSGCAGTNFKRSEASALVIGKSTPNDIIRVMGEPIGIVDVVRNGEKFQTYAYAYAEGVFGAKVLPVRLMEFYAFNDVLVGQQFVSSFPEDSTEFDASKISGIRTGKSTRAEVIALLGQPNGEVNYPLIKNKADRGIIYSYRHSRVGKKVQPSLIKELTVCFDANDVVSEMKFFSAEVR